MAAARRDPSRPALKHWMETRYEQPPATLPVLSDAPDRVQEFACRLASGAIDLHHLSFVNAAWIAARLWDRNWRMAPSPQAALRLWVDRWRVLGSPSLTPREAWGADDAIAFREAAFAVLEDDHGLLRWQHIRSAFVRQSARAGGRSDADYAQLFDETPERLLPRASWLCGRRQEAAVFHAMEATSDLAALANLLWSDVAFEPNAAAPHPVAARLLTLTIDRPELLAALLYRPLARPELLADILLHPPTAALAPWLVARKAQHGGAYDRELADQEHRAAQSEAFRDATYVLIWLVAQKEADAADAADLLAWLHDVAPDGFGDATAEGEPLHTILHDALLGLPGSAIRDMLAALVVVSADDARWPSVFAAVLELAQLQPVTDGSLATLVADSYLIDLAREQPRLRTGRISVGAAAALMTLPLSAAARARLLSGVDVRARLRAAQRGHNPLLLSGDVATALRQHIRMLSRAAARLGVEAPADLVSALLDAVTAGIEDKPAAARVAAFKPSFEAGVFTTLRDRPLAEDLAAALRALDNSYRDGLLSALLRTDEPMILAQLHLFAPTDLQGRIERRVSALTPDEAAEVFSLTDLQARADSFLAAGLVDAAAAFLDAERDARPMGDVPGRKVTQLQARLRLKLAAGDWEGLMNADAPEGLTPFEASEVRDLLLFYRALACLLRADDPDPAGAEAIFADLHGRKPQIKAYAQNLFAARVSRLLAVDLFGRVRGSAVLEARQLLSDRDGLVTAYNADLADRTFSAGHRALLHLALGEPAKALIDLATIPQDPVNPRAVAYQAVALARLGRVSEARIAIATAESVAGSRWLFDQARRHIETGVPVIGPAELAVEVHRLRDVAAALLNFMKMDPHDQAAVLHGPGATLENYLTDQIRCAASSLIRLVSVMKGAVLSDHEDDLNTVLGELLLSRLQLQGWDVPDQSRGGHSGSGNPGERDLLVKCGTVELCCIEALICEDPITWQREQTNLRKHFQKLFGYTASRVLYHVSYAFGLQLDAVIATLKELAASEAPAGWRMVEQTDLPPRDSRPSGFKARYAVSGDTAMVVFLVLDVGQERPRAAGAASRI
jgi:hypothetical protein